MDVQSHLESGATIFRVTRDVRIFPGVYGLPAVQAPTMMHSLQAVSEHTYVPVDNMDGNWFTLADGTRMLDFMSQLISDSMGHRHPAIHAELARAMASDGEDESGHLIDATARIVQDQLLRISIAMRKAEEDPAKAAKQLGSCVRTSLGAQQLLEPAAACMR